MEECEFTPEESFLVKVLRTVPACEVVVACLYVSVVMITLTLSNFYF